MDAASPESTSEHAREVERDCERVEELAPDGVVFDTDDVPSWPSNLVLLLALGSMVALAIATIGVVH